MARPVGRTVVRLACEGCGVEVQRNKGQVREHTFCSRECYWKSDYHRQTVATANKRRPAPDLRIAPCGGCGKSVTRHASRSQKELFCSRACRWESRKQPDKKQSKSGYVLVYVGRDHPGATRSGHIFEHRKVMQDLLGRPLLPGENVHHINGERADNRAENLELWTRSQPAGQRVADKIRWAREFLALYEPAEEVV